MAFDWSEYIEVAKTLADHPEYPANPCLEGKYRAAMSRSYYAAFCLTVEYLKKADNVQFSGPGRHNQLQQYLTDTCRRVTWKKSIGDILKTLYRWRVASDYDDVFTADNRGNFTDVELQYYAVRSALKAEQIKTEIAKHPLPLSPY